MVSFLIAEEGSGAGFEGSGFSPASQRTGLSSLEAGKVSDRCQYWTDVCSQTNQDRDDLR